MTWKKRDEKERRWKVDEENGNNIKEFKKRERRKEGRQKWITFGRWEGEEEQSQGEESEQQEEIIDNEGEK